jgi:hypothetical protein
MPWSNQVADPGDQEAVAAKAHTRPQSVRRRPISRSFCATQDKLRTVLPGNLGGKGFGADRARGGLHLGLSGFFRASMKPSVVLLSQVRA